MPTSELSNALNPNASQARRGSYAHEYSSPNYANAYPPAVQAPQQVFQQPHVPHVSELESAIVQPAAAVASHPTPRSWQAVPTMLSELARVVVSGQHAQETERKRRLAWEQEQEGKAAQQQAEMEKKLFEVESVIATLRSRLDTLNTPSPVIAHTNQFLSPQFTASSAPVPHPNVSAILHPVSPISPIFQSPVYEQPMFVQGSSNNPASSTGYHGQSTAMDPNSEYTRSTSQLSDISYSTRRAGIQFITPDPSPHLAFVETSRPSPISSGKSTKRKKKKTPSSSSSSDDDKSSSSLISSASERPRKRRSHHDTRCYTIHHAIRLHILQMLDVESDRHLPDSHTEGTSLGPSEPVRFVWDKTTKQSVHNGRMKTRVLEDIKDKKHIYKNVSQKDFTKKNLDAAFEQCFVTLRQKFKLQRDESKAEQEKKREDGKARKSRHISRRKIKLNNRSEARNKIAMFEHVTFDGALQLDCMSSEESDYELDPHSSQPCGILKTRGYGWRSTRLLQFYCTLDNEERADASSKPKRGSAKKERRVGPNKDKFVLPPQGVATWMISQRWYKSSLAQFPDLPQILEKLVDNPSGFNWADFHELGEESVDENETPNAHQHHQHAMQPFQSYSSHMHTLDLNIQPQHYNSGA